MNEVRDTVPATSEAGEFRRLVNKYPKLIFRSLVVVISLVSTGGGLWLTSAYGQFKATNTAVQELTEAHKGLLKDRGEVFKALAEREAANDRRFNEQRQDIQEIRKDIKELLRNSRPPRDRQ